MKKSLTTILVLVAVLAMAGNALAERTVEDRIKALEQKVRTLKVNDAKDKIQWSGDLRVEAHKIQGDIPDYIDGMRMQNLFFETMFMMNHPTFDPNMFDPTQVTAAMMDQFAMANYVDFQIFQSMTSFDDVKNWVQMMMSDPNYGPAFGMIMPVYAQDAYRQGFAVDNDILYTTRLRLNMDAKVAEDVSFAGRMSMYKPWGASTQTGVFNGQANTLNTDANWPGVPGDATLKVDRAYFTWSHAFVDPVYLSLGRRPSTDGPPLHYRHDEVRQGTPMGTLIDFQFDGATLGWHIGENSTLRACYGLGYESQYGNGLLSAENALKDAQFFGFNIDAWDTREMQIQTTIARAFDITDGFNGEIILPANPVTGLPMPGPIPTRFSPSANLGDFDIASVLVSRTDGPVDWFVTGSWSKSRPENVTGPFGGLMCDPYETPEEQTGSMYYVGARYNLPDGKTKFGVEWNKGSQYWFNFAPSQDDLIAPKTSTRGTVWESYLTHRIRKTFVVKLAYIHYDYDYTGSGWHVGAPKEISAETPAMVGFPTYSSADKFSLGFSARF
jgi:hypothetical protein